jgi:uncharacterized CHY-type Zn-finger protein
MEKVVVRGIIYRKYDDNERTGANWWLHPYCITLRTKTSGTFYMFFPSKQESEKHRFTPSEKVVVKGFLHRKSVRYQEKKCLTDIERASESDYVNYE